jgi:Holliday junction resolvase RusA-like endonuclease
MTRLEVWVPFLPPSSNKIYEPVYVQGKPRGKRLSDSGRRFKIRAMKIIQEGGRAAFMNLPEHVPYELTLAVFLEKIENQGWGSGSTANRYTKVDVTNRIKLIEDTVADAVGVDDRHNFRISLEKHCDPNNPGIYVSLREIPEQEVGLTKNEYELRLRQHKPHRARVASTAAQLFLSTSRTKQRNPNRLDRREATPE